MSSLSPSPLLSTQQVAEMLGRDPKTVRARVKQGKLEAVLEGRDYRFRRADVLDYMEKLECPSTNRSEARSGTMTSSTKANVTTVRRVSARSGQLRPWSEKNDLKPRPAPITKRQS
ncbi:helix-turn-helix domain-containing protein [Thalassovita mediterranea]|nr:helix-turn-helix domain-containing protein [Thalassovita mediterranea]